MANATRRALRIIKALQGKTFSGVSVTELATALDTRSSNICRDLNDLASEGFVEKRGDGRYQLSISLLQIAQSHHSETERLQQRIHEYNQRISRF